MQQANYERVSQLEESLMDRPPGSSSTAGVGGSSLPQASSTPLIEVVAPANLPEGYVFEARLGENRSIKVTVPPGGIEEGQKFTVPLPEQVENMITGNIAVPVGEWRDGLFECFRYGVCHPSVWTALCLPLIAAGQVIARLQLTWYGTPVRVEKAAGAFQVLFLVTVVYYVMRVSLFVAMWIMADDDVRRDVKPEDDGTYAFLSTLYALDFYVFWILSSLLLFRLRMYVREKYAIRESATDVKDCCLSFWCYCCVGAQMLRHTTDYDTYPATCCTERGIPAHAPSIV